MANRDSSRRARARSFSALVLALAIPGFLAGARAASAAAPLFGPVAPVSATAAVDGALDGAPALATDGQGTWVAVWESADTLGGTIGSDLDVLVSRSTDNGATWSFPAPLDPGAATDASFDGEPTVAGDASGHFVALWRSNNPALSGGRGSDYDLFVARSSDAGATWTAPAPLYPAAASDTGSEGQAELATDGHGTWIAAWQANNALGGALGSDLDILVARSTDAGASWSAPGPLHSNAATDTGTDATPRLASDGQGGWVAVWSSQDTLGGTKGTDHDVLCVRSADGGVTWSAPGLVNGNALVDSGHDVLPQVAYDAGGSWVVIWQSNDSLGSTKGVDYDILVARSADATTWSAPQPLNANAASDASADTAPTLASNGRGGLLAVWQANGALGGALGADVDLLMAASNDGGATWDAPAPVYLGEASDAGSDQTPHLASDGGATWMLAWKSTDSLGGTIGTDADPLVAVGLEPAVCGDGVLAPAEACDDGNTDPGDGCRADCTVELCGDGILDPAEACDDANADPGDGCRADCTAELCGDGILDPAEACDDGNAAQGDGCDASCQLEVPPLPGGGYASLVDAFDTAVGDGTLVGTGRGRSAEKHLRALRRLLQAAQRWLDDDRKGFGCGALKIALLALDGAPNPPDLATGPAATLLAAQIGEAMQEVGCHLPKPRPPRHDRHDHDRP